MIAESTISKYEFIRSIIIGRVPDGPPATIHDWREHLDIGYEMRNFCTSRGMWAIVDKQWTRQLADWIGDQQVLEVMAGAGWLAKALAEHGVDIIATDNYSWDDHLAHHNLQRVYAIECMDAVAAIYAYDNADILLVSWPYMDKAILDVCEAWGSVRPIVFIGEGEGGCTACDEFYQGFEVEQYMDIPQWYGIHDGVMIGYWRGNATD